MSSVNDLPSTAIDFIHDPSARDSRIIISNIAEFDYNSPDVFPAMIINHLMGGDLLSNIQASLGAAPYSENIFSLSPDPLGGYMYLSVRVPNLDAVRTITEKTARLQSIRRTPLDSTTLASVKQYLIGRIALSFEDREAMGSYGVAVENGTVKQDFLEDILRQINDVTSEDVMRVAQKYIKPSQFRIVIYGDARKVVPPLELAGYDVTFYDKTAQRVARPSLSQPITDSISVRDVLERYFEAMGGEKKMRAVKTLRQQYDILIGDRKLQAVVLARLPFYYQQLLLFDDEVYLKTTYNGNMGYTKVENTTTALSADAVEKGRLSRSIFPLLDYEKEGFQAELDSIVPVLGHFTYRMNVTLPEGKMQNYYFSTEDYRVLRIEEVTSRAVKPGDALRTGEDSFVFRLQGLQGGGRGDVSLYHRDPGRERKDHLEDHFGRSGSVYPREGFPVGGSGKGERVFTLLPHQESRFVKTIFCMKLPPRARSQFDGLQVVDFPVVQGKAQQGAHVVDAVSPGGTGVEVHDTQAAVHHHFQDVRMPADEQRGGSGEEFLLHAAVVVPGIASDVFEQDFHPFLDKAKPLGKRSADLSAIGIAIDGPKGSYGRKTIGNAH